MGEQAEEKNTQKSSKHICIGLLAHVDAGKTTLSESILYLCGNIRKPGRVDHGDAFLDTHALERDRGITIFSKQAELMLDGVRVTMLDTPGHVDFAAETERTLPVLDYAILVINGADGVQGHTRTLWGLLKRYGIPAFVFVNKMDQKGTDKRKLLDELRNTLDEGCIAFDGEAKERDMFWEQLALSDEAAMEEYIGNERIGEETIVRLIGERKVFPCYFGSALKTQGVDTLLEGIRRFTTGGRALGGQRKETELFGARVYKISRDSQGNRLTHLRVTSGKLRVRDSLKSAENAPKAWEEKVNQIRLYSGEKYEMLKEAEAGMVCAITGLTHTYPGEGLGAAKESRTPILQPVLSYHVRFPESMDPHTMLQSLRQLEEEDPLLRIVWNEELEEIHVQLMGEVQIEILKSLIQERFGVTVSFDTGKIVYKETIRKVVEGVGHFEPLRHYAEVHLLLEPKEAGSGVTFTNCCSEDMLDRNWQRLILTHLAEKEHRGVLLGAPVTDIQFTLLAGRAHIKHTEGGDFRQATYRAVRQGLMQADSVLLEPYYRFRLEVPAEYTGRALADIQKMQGEFAAPETSGEMSLLTGKAPVAGMRDYQREVSAYTRGQGRLFCEFDGYAPCGKAGEVIAEMGYDAERDVENPPGSIFCTHGAGFYVPWDRVPEYMHIESQFDREDREETEREAADESPDRKSRSKLPGRDGDGQYERRARQERELEEIFIRTYGRVERKQSGGTRTITADSQKKAGKQEEPVQEYLLVDGYNVIFAWDDLKELANENIEAARNKLMDILCNYQGFKKCILILVFDAYKVDNFEIEILKYHNIHVVYTKRAETADQYIEKVVHEIGRKYHVTVVTSDGVEQVITLGQGGTLISSREFLKEVELTRRQIYEEYEKRRDRGKNYLFQHMDRELAEDMEKIRLGKK